MKHSHTKRTLARAAMSLVVAAAALPVQAVAGSAAAVFPEVERERALAAMRVEAPVTAEDKAFVAGCFAEFGEARVLHCWDATTRTLLTQGMGRDESNAPVRIRTAERLSADGTTLTTIRAVARDGRESFSKSVATTPDPGRFHAASAPMGMPDEPRYSIRAWEVDGPAEPGLRFVMLREDGSVLDEQRITFHAPGERPALRTGMPLADGMELLRRHPGIADLRRAEPGERQRETLREDALLYLARFADSEDTLSIMADREHARQGYVLRRLELIKGDDAQGEAEPLEVFALAAP